NVTSLFPDRLGSFPTWFVAHLKRNAAIPHGAGRPRRTVLSQAALIRVAKLDWCQTGGSWLTPEIVRRWGRIRRFGFWLCPRIGLTARCRRGEWVLQPTDIANPNYFHKVVDCQWACPAHTPVP